MRVDFTNVKSNFDPLPEGNYSCTVFSIEEKKSQAGNPYLNFQLKIQGGDFDGRRAFYIASLLPQSLWNLKQVLQALGMSEEELKGNFDLDTSDLLGRECDITIEWEMYQGENRDRVVKIAAPGSLTTTGDLNLYR
jgi:hypothetical protein